MDPYLVEEIYPPQISFFKVKPGEDPYKKANDAHVQDETRIRIQRRKVMKGWAEVDAAAVKNEKSDYLDKQRMTLILHPRLPYINPNNVTESVASIREAHGDDEAERFKKDKSTYKSKMKILEERFELFSAQTSYKEYREKLAKFTYKKMDDVMKKDVNSDWVGYHDLDEELTDLHTQYNDLNDRYAKRGTKINELKARIVQLEKHLSDAYANDAALVLKLAEDEKNEEKNKKRKSNN